VASWSGRKPIALEPRRSKQAQAKGNATVAGVACGGAKRIALAFVLSSAVAASGALAQTASASGKIAFVRDGDIWVMDADGLNQTNLTNTPEIDESQPEWSADGTKLVFTLHTNPAAFGDIYSMDVDPATDDAANLTNTPGFDEYQPSWAPSGTRLVFVREVAGEVFSEQPDIFVMDADGGNATNITQRDERELYPAWSPDGTRIAFAGVREGGWEILTMDPTGQDEQIVTGDGVDGIDAAPEWSPDSSKIAFMKQSQAQGCCEPWEIWAVNRDGTGDTNLTNHPSDDMGPSWSPDGSQITFSSTRDADAPGEADIYAMPAPTVLQPPSAAEINATGTAIRLTRNQGSSEPDWGRANTAPRITALLPARDATTTDRTPTIGAKVADAETNLSKAHIALFLDGTRIASAAYTYNRDTDRLRYTPTTTLPLGRHSVRVVARDPQGLVARKIWSFRIVRA
jgi:Tol biopolymer transport system component